MIECVPNFVIGKAIFRKIINLRSPVVREFLTPVVGPTGAPPPGPLHWARTPTLQSLRGWLLKAYRCSLRQRIVPDPVGASCLSREIVFLPMLHSLEE